LPCQWFLLFFFRDRTSQKKKARGAIIFFRLVDLREIKTYLLKPRGTPGDMVLYMVAWLVPAHAWADENSNPSGYSECQ
jgi:hypothetical protein